MDETGLRLGLGDATKLGKLAARWRGIVGDAIAHHAEPTSLKAGTLRVRTDSAVWATEISYLGGEIKRRANDALAEDAVVEVRVWTGPGAVHHAAGPPPLDRGEKRTPEARVEWSTAFDRARAAWARRAPKTVADAARGESKQRETPW